MAKETQIQRTKSAPPPPELPIYGRVNPDEVTFIGRTNYVAALEEKKFVFGLKRQDRKNNTYILGKSGVGKSKLIELMARQDIAGKHGVCVLDSTNEIIESLLNFIPQERIKDTVLIDFTNLENPACFNPFAGINPDFKHQFAEDFVEIMQIQSKNNWNAQTEHILRLSCLAVLDLPETGLKNIVGMLENAEYRTKIIPQINDVLVKRFWENEFNVWREKFEIEAVAPLINKLNQLLLNPYLQKILNCDENKINFTDFLNNKKIVLVNLGKNKLGEENSNFLGHVIIGKIKEACSGEGNKDDFYLYADEFPPVITKTFENLLTDARKHNLSVTMSSQSLSKLAPEAQTTILSNTGTLIIFRLTGEDALKIKPEVAPVFDIKDMTGLGLQQFYVKMTIDGEIYDPFSAETLKVLNPPDKSSSGEIKKISQGKYNLSF